MLMSFQPYLEREVTIFNVCNFLFNGTKFSVFMAYCYEEEDAGIPKDDV